MHPRHASHGRDRRGLVAAGRSYEEILREYPYLEANDITEALSCAVWLADEVEFPEPGGETFVDDLWRQRR